MKATKVILVIIALMFSISLVFAQEAAEQAAPTQTEAVTEATPEATAKPIITPGEIFQDSGFWGVIIILVFVIGLAMAIVRYIQLWMREKIDAKQLYFKLKNFIRQDQIEDASKVAEGFKETTLGFIFWSGIQVFKEQKKSISGKVLRDSVQNAFDEAVLQKVHQLDSGLWWFDTLAQLCTYLGLLGTIWGLLKAFKGLGGGSQAESANLTKGIAEAIGTTAMGLVAAIPLTIIKGLLKTRADKLIADVDEYCVKLINNINATIKD